MPAEVQNTAASAATVTSLAVAYLANNTAGNLLVVTSIAVQAVFGDITSVTDTQGNTWHRATTTVSNSTHSIAIFYAANCAAGANTVTVNYAASCAQAVVRVLEYSGVNALDVTATATGSSTVASVTFTPSAAGELAVLEVDTVGTFPSATPPAGYVLRNTTQFAPATADEVSTPAGAQTPTWNVAGCCCCAPVPQPWEMAAAVFKLASAAAAPEELGGWAAPVAAIDPPHRFATDDVVLASSAPDDQAGARAMWLRALVLPALVFAEGETSPTSATADEAALWIAQTSDPGPVLHEAEQTAAPSLPEDAGGAAWAERLPSSLFLFSYEDALLSPPPPAPVTPAETGSQAGAGRWWTYSGVIPDVRTEEARRWDRLEEQTARRAHEERMQALLERQAQDAAKFIRDMQAISKAAAARAKDAPAAAAPKPPEKEDLTTVLGMVVGALETAEQIARKLFRK